MDTVPRVGYVIRKGELIARYGFSDEGRRLRVTLELGDDWVENEQTLKAALEHCDGVAQQEYEVF